MSMFSGRGNSRQASGGAHSTRRRGDAEETRRRPKVRKGRRGSGVSAEHRHRLMSRFCGARKLPTGQRRGPFDAEARRRGANAEKTQGKERSQRERSLRGAQASTDVEVLGARKMPTGQRRGPFDAETRRRGGNAEKTQGKERSQREREKKRGARGRTAQRGMLDWLRLRLEVGWIWGLRLFFGGWPAGLSARRSPAHWPVRRPRRWKSVSGAWWILCRPR